MPRFTLLTETVEFRGEKFVVREMTAAEKMRWAAAVRKNPAVTLSMAVEICTDETPPLNADALAQEPTLFVEALARAIFKLSGIGDGEKKALLPTNDGAAESESSSD